MSLTLKDQKSRDYVISLFHDYLLREHRSDLFRLSSSPPHVHQSVIVHFNCLCEFDSVFSELLLIRPHDTLTLLDDGLRVALGADRFVGETGSGLKKQPFRHVHVRLTALPVIPEVHRNTIPWSIDVGKFLALRATVSRVGPIQVFEERVYYLCTKCGFKFPVIAKLDQHYVVRPPRFCPNREKGCHSVTLKPCADGSFHAKNYQEIRVHERYRCLSVGLMPRSIAVCLEDDLLEMVKPGDDVVVNGVVIRRWQAPREGLPCEISLAIKANYIENLSELKTGVSSNRLSTEQIVEFQNFWSAHSVTVRDALEARNQLVRSICPEVCVHQNGQLQVTSPTQPRDSLWSVDRLREYFSWIRQEFKPHLSFRAANLLQRYYVWRRKHVAPEFTSQQHTLHGRSTLRLLESLVRLTKAHARLMAHKEAGEEDAIVAIALMDASLQSTTYSVSMPSVIGPQWDQLTISEAIVASDIPEDAGLEFTRWEQGIRQSLENVQSESLGTELEIVEEEKQISPSSSPNTTPPYPSNNRTLAVDSSPFDLNSSIKSTNTDSSPVLSAFALTPKHTKVDFDVSLSFGPILTSTQHPNNLKTEQEICSKKVIQWGDLHAGELATDRPVISWPEPVTKSAFRPGKRPNTVVERSQQMTKTGAKLLQQTDRVKSPQSPELCSPKLDWKSRASSKLARYSAASPLKSPPVVGSEVATASSTSLSVPTPATEQLNSGSNRLFDVHLTNEDFEIDL